MKKDTFDNNVAVSPSVPLICEACRDLEATLDSFKDLPLDFYNVPPKSEKRFHPKTIEIARKLIPALCGETHYGVFPVNGGTILFENENSMVEVDFFDD